MEGLKNMPKKLPESSNDFEIDVKGIHTNQSFRGNFKCKIPTLRDQALISKHNAYLNGDVAQYLDFQTIKLHRMISYLKYVITESPKFWREADYGYELLDMNVVEEVYNKALEFEEAWMREIWGDEKVEAMKKAMDPEQEPG